MEHETRPGVFISVITRQTWLRRTELLTGDELRYFLEQCNPAKYYDNVWKDDIGVNRDEMFEILRKLDSDFDPQTDYYVIRYQPQAAIH
jgi:hypothetical protein